MKIYRIRLEPWYEIVLANGKRFRVKLYTVHGHGRGIHIPSTSPAYEIDVESFIGQLKECILEKRQTPKWEHDPNLGYYGTYIELPR